MNSKGQSLIEVIAAITVGILVVMALTFTTLFSLRNAGFAKNSAQATKLAQEGLERARTGRDRNNQVTISGVYGINYWSDLWSYQIQTSGDCAGGKCYFNVSSAGVLNDNDPAATSFPAGADIISFANQSFQRTIVITDDADYATQKIVTAIVRWTDSTGPHDSRVTTILRKL